MTFTLTAVELEMATLLCVNLSQAGFEELLPELIIKLRNLHLDKKKDFLENFSDLNSTRLIVKRRVKFRLSTVFTLLCQCFARSSG